ncbi:DUF6979 family protein [Aeromonas sobria]|uniref:DUF6979 family protein n=1 Tax=Aeromonas sobria TaxID=646 RepID=UPI000C6E0026|nr:hypothetical protein [Aeromonas sobria]PKQ71402.1 hypothetical protein CJF47_20595 [Aeromonas sobria]
MDYGNAAVTAAKMCENGKLAPRDAWVLAVKDEGGSSSSQEKSCPKSAFLGLCGKGLVRGVSKGNYSRSVLNSCYAVTAVQILQSLDGQRLDRSGLWDAVMARTGKQIRHNCQMDVVLALWAEGIIEPSSPALCATYKHDCA